MNEMIVNIPEADYSLGLMESLHEGGNSAVGGYATGETVKY